MKAFTKIFFFVILFSYLQFNCFAQEDNKKMAFISVNSGIYMPSAKGFKDVYNSNFTFINGISVGIPFSNENFFFYLKAMYFQKSGTPITYHIEYDFTTDNYDKYITQEGTIVLKQFIGNIGVQYNLVFSSNDIILFNSGLTLIKATEKTKDTSLSSDVKGLNGFFCGIGYEKKLFDKLSLLSEFQYNFDIWGFKILDYDAKIKYGGANLNVGVRYYFKQKK